MSDEEIDFRRLALGRIAAAWPQAKLGRDTIEEYVNCTRGVPLSQLSGFVTSVIEIGGDFAPPAGELVQRYARAIAETKSRKYHLHLTPREVFDRELIRASSRMREATRAVAAIGDSSSATSDRISELASNQNVTHLLDRVGRNMR